MSGGEDDWEARCLSTDPFAGDFSGGGEGDGVLSDKMVTARKAGECHACAGQLQPGTRVRRRAEVYDSEFMRFGWCEPCCRAMAQDAYVDPVTDEWVDPFEDRIETGQRARKEAAQ